MVTTAGVVSGHRARWRTRLLAWAAVMLVAVGGCASTASAPAGVPDAELTAELAEVPVVELRGPDNPTLDPDVLAEFWDSARVRSATSPPVAPARGIAPLLPRSDDPRSDDPRRDDPAPVPSVTAEGRPFVSALLVRGPAGPGLATELQAAAAVVEEVVTAPVLDRQGQTAGLASRATGRLFFTVGGQPRSCTAAAVTSGSGSVVATAGHCLLTDGAGGPRLAATNFLFGPGYRDGEFPLGRWAVESVHLTVGWARSPDWSQDVAFLRMAPSAQTGPLQNTVGALGVVFDTTSAARPGVRTALLGYPSVAPFDGATLRWCATSSPAPPPPVDPGGFGLRCEMTAGYSGGPAVTRFDPATGTGYLAGIASHDYGTGIVFGASLGAAALAAYTEADQE